MASSTVIHGQSLAESWGSQTSGGVDRDSLQMALSAPNNWKGPFLCLIKSSRCSEPKKQTQQVVWTQVCITTGGRMELNVQTQSCNRLIHTHTHTYTVFIHSASLSSHHFTSLQHESKCFQCHCPPTLSSVHHYTIWRAIYSCMGKLSGTAASQEYQSS